LNAVSLSIVGPNADADASSPESRGAQKFHIIEGEPLREWMDKMEQRTGQASTGDGNTGAAGGGGTIGDAVPMEE
jgi:20S proteasome subunit alpha 6